MPSGDDIRKAICTHPGNVLFLKSEEGETIGSVGLEWEEGWDYNSR